MSSGCYFRLHNDMRVANRKIYNHLVYNILRFRSLEPLPLGFTAAEKDRPSPIHEFSKQIKDLYLLTPEAEIPFPRLRKCMVKEY